MKELYTTIQNLFSTEATKAVFNEAHLYPPEFIDLYNGQPESPEEFEFTTPAYSLIIRLTGNVPELWDAEN